MSLTLNLSNSLRGPSKEYKKKCHDFQLVYRYSVPEVFSKWLSKGKPNHRERIHVFYEKGIISNHELLWKNYYIKLGIRFNPEEIIEGIPFERPQVLDPLRDNFKVCNKNNKFDSEESEIEKKLKNTLKDIVIENVEEHPWQSKLIQK